MDEEIGTPGLGVMAHGVDQMLADKRARTSYIREKNLMRMQNSMNIANAKMAPSIQVEGLRMAGFNPAMVNGAGTAPAPTVSKGSADMAQTFPLDIGGLAQLALLDAQRENVEAQTEKTKAETVNVSKTGENIEADTAEKVARTLKYPEEVENIKADTDVKGAQAENVKTDTGLKVEQTEKVKQEAQSIRNTNEVFTEENKGISLFGQTMAMDWQRQDWYKSLPSGTKMVIDQVADGTVDLTVGSLRALITAIDTDGNMNKMQKDKAEYALSAAIAQGMLSDPKVKEALVKMPFSQRNKIINETSKLIQETKALKFDYDWTKEKKGIWDEQDPAKAYNNFLENPTFENFMRWFNNSLNDKLDRAVPGAAGAAVGGAAAGRAAGKGMEKAAEKAAQAPNRDRKFPIEDIMRDPDDPHGIHKMFRKASGKK